MIIFVKQSESKIVTNKTRELSKNIYIKYRCYNGIL